MFAAEVYDNILRNLSRDDLDTMQLVSRYSDSTVKNIPADCMPRRVLHRLYVQGHGKYVIEREEGSSRTTIHDEGSLTARMKFALVGCLAFAQLMDGPAVLVEEALLNVLLLQKEAWKIGKCEVGFSLSCTFASTESPLMASAAVQYCRSFVLRTSDNYNLNVDDLVAWLHRDHEWRQPLTLFLSARNVNTPQFIGALKEIFARSKQPHHYAVHVHMPDNWVILEEVLYNKNTSERLDIARGSHGDIVVKRKVLKKE